MNFTKARDYMVNRQIKPNKVDNPLILDLLLTIPREEFVADGYGPLAYADTFVPIGASQVALPPKLIGQMLQNLEIKATDQILEIGTGTGYITTLLAKLGNFVTSIEIEDKLYRKARENLAHAGIKNVSLLSGDGRLGVPSLEPQDIIVYTGSMPKLPKEIKSQIKVGGKIFALIGDEKLMHAIIVSKVSDDEFITNNLLETFVPPLKGIPKTDNFVF